MAIVTGTKMEIVIGSMAAPEVATDALARYEVAPAKTPAPVPAAAVVEAAKPAAPALWAATIINKKGFIFNNFKPWEVLRQINKGKNSWNNGK